MLELRIAKPCDQTWTAMKGDEQVRHCRRCDKNVYNIAQMTEAEVEELIRRTEGHFCARLYRRTDNRVMTKDCPKGVAAVRRRRTIALAAAGATMVFGYPLTRPVYAGAVSIPADSDREARTLGKVEVISKREEAEERVPTFLPPSPSPRSGTGRDPAIPKEQE